MSIIVFIIYYIISTFVKIIDTYVILMKKGPDMEGLDFMTIFVFWAA